MFDTVFEDKNFAAHLKFADPYIGLRELYEAGKINTSDIDPIILRPRASGQVFPDSPERVSPRGERDAWVPGWGTVSPHEKHLHVTRTVSNLDWNRVYPLTDSFFTLRSIQSWSTARSILEWKTAT